jgi:cytoskeletal protein CcmA (bactofilin family)
MFRREKEPEALDRIEVVIGPTANFKGDLECDGIVKVDGTLHGSIKTLGNVIISQDAQVDAHVEAQNVSVSGLAKGSIVAKGRLEILSTGKVWADVTVSSFLLDDGGKLHGNLHMYGTGPEPQPFNLPTAARSATQVAAEDPGEPEPEAD